MWELDTEPHSRVVLSARRFIYAAEDAELAAYITSEQTRRSPMCQAVVLFPSSRAISSDEFMAELRQRQCRAQDGAASIGSEAGGDDSAQKLDKSAEHRVPTTSSSTKLIIIVVVSKSHGRSCLRV